MLALLGLFLCLGSYAFLTLWRRRERDDDEFLPYSREDAFVYRTAFTLCALSLAVSLGSALLLPISKIRSYPDFGAIWATALRGFSIPPGAAIATSRRCTNSPWIKP